MSAHRSDPHGETYPADPAWIPVIGALIQRAPLVRDYSVGRVVVSFDPAHCNDVLFLFHLQSRVSALRSHQPRTPDEYALRELFTSPPIEGRWRRWELPRSLTEGVPAYLCEIKLWHDLMPQETEYSGPHELSLLPCRADPSRGGGMELLPYGRQELRRRHEQFVRAVSRKGVKVNAALVQANADLFSPGREPLPGLVLITFERDVPDQEAYLRRLADRVYDLKTARPRDREEDEVRDIVMASEQAGVLYRRRQLPARFTGGPVVYAADLLIYRPYLHRGYLTEKKVLPCVAEPGPEGLIELLPYWDESGAGPEREEIPEVLPVAGPAGAAPRHEEVLDAVPVAGRGRRRLTREDEPRPPRKKRGKGLLLALLIGLVLGGGLWWFFFRWDVTQEVTLSETYVYFMLPGVYGFEYQFNHGGPTPGVRYYLVSRSTKTGVTTSHLVIMVPGKTHGSFRVDTEIREGRFECHLEAEQPGGVGGRTRISNTIVVP
jgi:hypothetical protein